MNTFQKVLNQLSKAQKLQEKTELTTQKVELGIIDDLNDVLQKSDTIIKELRDNENIVARNQKLLKDREKDQSKLITNSDKFRKEFFDLRDKVESAKQKSERADKELDANSRVSKMFKKILIN